MHYVDVEKSPTGDPLWAMYWVMNDGSSADDILEECTGAVLEPPNYDDTPVIESRRSRYFRNTILLAPDLVDPAMYS